MCEADDLTTFICRMSLKSGSLKLLEPPGPHRACYGTALPLYVSIKEDVEPDAFISVAHVTVWFQKVIPMVIVLYYNDTFRLGINVC